MTVKSIITGLLFGLTLTGAANQTNAAQQLVVYTDQSKILNMARAPGIVVIGNPSIADATIQGRKVFVHGRSFGTTNIIILDDDGEQLADFEIDVQLGGQNNVAVYKAGSLFSYVCAENCETQMHPGDNPDYFKELASKPNQEKMSFATGQKSAEANEPPPPQ